MTLFDLAFAFIDFINFVLVPVIFSLSFLSFLWGVYNFYFINDNKGNDQRKDGRTFIMWGLIAFFVMFSIWGIVNLLVDSLGLSGVSSPPVPLFGN